MTQLTQVSHKKCFGGWQNRYQHTSTTLKCDMHLSVYLPPQAEVRQCPVLYFLSGLTCTDENFVTKAGAQRMAAKLGIILVTPDTSPRGEGVSDADNAAYDLGLGAGFYVNATQRPWADHYQMYSYVVDELPNLIDSHLPTNGRVSISGHSMGGHGALTIALSNLQRYSSVSAFAPIVNPMACPWGEKALTAYLGTDRDTWADYDSCALVRKHGSDIKIPLLIDQGNADEFLTSQSLTRPFETAAEEVGFNATIRYHDAYDHSYFFIASFIEEHLRFHAEHLCGPD